MGQPDSDRRTACERRPNAADDLPRAATQTFGEACAGTHDGGHSLGGLFELFFVIARLPHDGRKLTSAPTSTAQMRHHRISKQRDGLEPVFPIDRQCTENGFVHFFVHVAAGERGNDYLGIFNRALGRSEVAREKGIVSREHLIRQRRKGPFVGAHVGRLKTHLLEGHVSYGSSRRLAESGLVGKLGQAEIGHLHLTLPVYEHVVGLDVQVQNLIVVSDLERMGYGFEHAGHHVEGKRTALFAHELGQRHAVDIFHDKVGHGAFYLEIVHADDVRIGQHGRRTRFIKTWNVTWRRRRCGLSKRIKTKTLDGHAALDARIPRNLHGREPAAARNLERTISVQDKILHPMQPFIYNRLIIIYVLSS